MKQLSGLDASFLYLETAQMPMHVGSLALLELPRGTKGRFVVALRKHMRSRLEAAPPLRQRLWWMPLNIANPVWVDADPDITSHVAEVKLRKGATLADVEAKVGELHPLLLDRRRPLWKFWVFDDLEPGPHGARRVAVYSQVHHAAVDGQAAVALANAIYQLDPQSSNVGAAKSARPRRFRLGMAEMVSGALANQLQQLTHLVRTLPDTVSTLAGAATQALKRKSPVSNLTLAPRTPLNVSVSERRAFAGVSLPFEPMKSLAKAHGATLNDIVLWLCSSALRRRLAARGALPRKSLLAAVPMSLREQGDAASDNQVSISAVSLGTHIADPLRRLAHVKAATAAMKAAMGSVKRILPTDFPSLGVPWLMEAAVALYGRAKLADRIPQLANVAISNVPGPPVPLYLAGAKLLAVYPTSIVVHGIALNITVQSYHQGLHFGLMACADAMPDVRAAADAIRDAFEELQRLTPSGDGALPEVTPRIAAGLRRRRAAAAAADR